MASFLRKIVAKSRSKSPQKRQSVNGHAYTGLNHADEEFHHWSPSASPDRGHRSRKPHNQHPPLPYGSPPQIRRLPTYPQGSDVFLHNDHNEVGVFSYEPHSSDRAVASSSAVPGSMASLRNDATSLSPGTWQNLTPRANRKTYASAAELIRDEPWVNETNFGSSNDMLAHPQRDVDLMRPDTSVGYGTFPVGTAVSCRQSLPRPRSSSPRKTPSDQRQEKDHRSRSPTKRTTRPVVNSYDYLQAQCRIEGCSAAIIVDDSRFLVCKHQLAHASDFFRALFLNNRALPIEGVRQTSVNEYVIVVSSLRYPPQSVQFQWFLDCTIPNPTLKDITEETLETCMRLSKRFSSKGLEILCAKYIHENVDNKKPTMALCWLNWALKHRFDQSIVDICLPVVARLPLTVLERHRQMMTEKILADMLATKLRTCYNQTVNVFHTIHKSDHFHVDLDKCPRCSRQVEQGKIRVLANPCHKLLGCERCLRDFGCEIERKSRGDYQAFYQCEHQLLPFHERTEDCQCQRGLYKASFAAASKLRFDENDSPAIEGIVVEPASTATTPLPSKR